MCSVAFFWCVLACDNIWFYSLLYSKTIKRYLWLWIYMIIFQDYLDTAEFRSYLEPPRGQMEVILTNYIFSILECTFLHAQTLRYRLNPAWYSIIFFHDCIMLQSADHNNLNNILLVDVLQDADCLEHAKYNTSNDVEYLKT